MDNSALNCVLCLRVHLSTKSVSTFIGWPFPPQVVSQRKRNKIPNPSPEKISESEKKVLFCVNASVTCVVYYTNTTYLSLKTTIILSPPPAPPASLKKIISGYPRIYFFRGAQFRLFDVINVSEKKTARIPIVADKHSVYTNISTYTCACTT